MKLSLPILSAASLMTAQAAPAADLVEQLVGFPKASFKIYSGMLHVEGPVGGYDTVDIHYEFHESQNDPANDPVTTWHQGGPGGNSIYGAYGEMGYFQLEDKNSTFINSHSWNRVSNMLYLESPAGSNDPIGFSYCSKGGKMEQVCNWNDVTQAEAYALTLAVFFKEFPEYAKNDLYLTGESYAGQYIPNIAHYILNHDTSLNLKGIAVGNGCWGGTETSVNCNGPNALQNDVDLLYGKGLVSKPLYKEIYATCDFPPKSGDTKCESLLQEASQQAGPHNVYDIYDNCPNTANFLKRSGKSMYWLLHYLRAQMSNGTAFTEYNSHLLGLSGGYEWSCNGISAVGTYFARADVRKAMHLGKANPVQFNYETSGPASVLLYPELVKKLRVLIYNGDADTCVPYKGNEEWTEGMEAAGHVKTKEAWHPWYTEEALKNGEPPAGYATSYSVVKPENAHASFDFVTIRLAGHMVPAFQPSAAFGFFSKWIAKKPF